MSNYSIKPLRLLIARCHNTPLWSRPMATSQMPTTTTTTRTFSSRNDDSNNGGGGFRLRRPQGSGRRLERGGRPNRKRREEPKYVYGGSAIVSEPKPSWLRNNMIDLFPGKYDDQPGEEMSEDDDADDDGYDEFDEETLAKLYQDDKEYEAKKERWIQNAMPPERVPVIDFAGRSYGRGARKRAQARVWITPGFGNVTVNRKDMVDYFPRRTDREQILDPLVVTETCGQFDLQCQVKGGGLTGQAGAIRLGVARALQHWNPDYRPPMKAAGFLTRDARKVERKKIGHVKARKKPQWNRR